jgi:hypothetical protein
LARRPDGGNHERPVPSTAEERCGHPDAIDTMRDAVGLVNAVRRGNRTDVMVLYESHRDDPTRLVGAMGFLASTLLDGWASTLGEDPEQMLRSVSLELSGAGE